MSRILIQAIEEQSEEPYLWVWDWDVSKDVSSLMLGLGTGAWFEMRVTGDSEEALDRFRNLLIRGGYSGSPKPFNSATLYKTGDECWEGFIFIDPTPGGIRNTVMRIFI